MSKTIAEDAMPGWRVAKAAETPNRVTPKAQVGTAGPGNDAEDNDTQHVEATGPRRKC